MGHADKIICFLSIFIMKGNYRTVILVHKNVLSFFIGFVRADFRFDILTLYSGLLDLLCSVDIVLPIYSLSVRVVDWMRKDLCAHNSLVVLVLLNPSENLK